VLLFGIINEYRNFLICLHTLGNLSNARVRVADIALPSRLGEEPSKISAGESVLVIHTPKGLYIRTAKGRIYAANSGNHSFVSAGTAVPSFQQSLQPVYSGSSTGSWLSRSDGGGSTGLNAYGDVQYYDTTSGLSSNPFAVHPSSVHFDLPSSNTSDDAFGVDPMSFVNSATSYDGNLAWSSQMSYPNIGDTRSDGVSFSTESPLSGMWQPQIHWGTPHRVTNTPQQSSTFSDLPSDLQCLEASSAALQTSLSNSVLPALSVRNAPSDAMTAELPRHNTVTSHVQQNDADSLDSLILDDYDNFADCQQSSDVEPVIEYSGLYSSYSGANFVGTSSLSSIAASDALNIDDFTPDWEKLSPMMNDL